MSGFWKGDAIASGIAEATAGIIAHENSKADLARTTRLVEERDKALEANAANYAEKYALRAALAKLNPDHPLISNLILQEKIRETGKRVLGMTEHDWDAVAEAGRTFKY